MLYAVCTECSFLRVYSRAAHGTRPPEGCPACGAELVVRRAEGRFPPAYMSRVSLELHAAPELRPDQGQAQA